MEFVFQNDGNVNQNLILTISEAVLSFKTKNACISDQVHLYF